MRRELAIKKMSFMIFICKKITLLTSSSFAIFLVLVKFFPYIAFHCNMLPLNEYYRIKIHRPIKEIRKMGG